MQPPVLGGLFQERLNIDNPHVVHLLEIRIQIRLV